ncbi:Beta-1,3-galactosyltransferase 1 [Chamberlinius hualienensis]
MALKYGRMLCPILLFITIGSLLTLNMYYTINLKRRDIENLRRQTYQLSGFNISAIKTKAIAPWLLQKVTNFTIEEFSICSQLKTDLYVLIYVHTAPHHFKQRSLIRQTYGSRKLYNSLKSVTVFFIGQILDNETALGVKAESERYHDIIQSDYVDNYKNLSFKAISAFKWVTDNCANAKFILKVDDDVFVNVFGLVRFLKSMENEKSTRLVGIHGLKWLGMEVFRKKYSKWYVSKDEYPFNTFPMYCSGTAYIMDSVVVPQLYNAVATTPFLWVDDVYATGLLANKAGVKLHSINRFMAFVTNYHDDNFNLDVHLFIHVKKDGGLDFTYKLWTKLLEKEGIKLENIKWS